MEKKLIYDRPVYDTMIRRLDRLTATSPRVWGKMTPAQMLAHLNSAIEDALGKNVVPDRSNFLTKTLVKRFILSSRPFMKNAPTAKSLVIPDERNFHAEGDRLRGNLHLALDRNTKGPWAHHMLFGPMTPEEWGWLQFKHIDHHFRQFGV